MKTASNTNGVSENGGISNFSHINKSPLDQTNTLLMSIDTLKSVDLKQTQMGNVLAGLKTKR